MEVWPPLSRGQALCDGRKKVFPSPWKGEGEGGGRSVNGGHKLTHFTPHPNLPP